MTLGPRTAAVLAAMLVALAGCSTADDPADDPVQAVTAGAATADLLARGTVTVDGTPLAGATVVLQASPVTDAADDGVGAVRWSAPAVQTDADGRWSLDLDPADIPVSYFPEGRSFLDFDLVFGDGARLAVWAGTVFRRSGPDTWRTEGAGTPDGVLQVDVDLGTGDVTATDSRGEPILPEP